MIGFRNLDRSLLEVAESIVDPDLDDIGALCRKLFHLRGCFCGRHWLVWDAGDVPFIRGESVFHREAATRREDARHIGASLALLSAHFVHQRLLVGAERGDGRGAVPRIELQIAGHPFAREEPHRILHLDVRIGHVRVQIDEPGHHELAGEILHGCARRRLQLGRRANPCDAAIGREERGIRNRRAAAAIDQGEIAEDENVGCGRRCGCGGRLGRRASAPRNADRQRDEKRLYGDALTSCAPALLPATASRATG